jgi:energy-coupling factor transport system ATP-binding protein
LKPLLYSEKVSFTYPQNHRSCGTLSLSLRQGESVLVHGPSGGGKSTMARCLAGLIPHLYHGQMTGDVWIGDHNTKEMRSWEIAREVGFVFQNPATQMVASTVEDELLFGLENLGLPREEIKTRLDFVVDQFQLDSFLKRSPYTLSGGEQQKLSLAAIIAMQPSVLIMDEPLSMLDSSAAYEFIDLLKEQLEEGKSLVFFEHRLPYLQDFPGLKRIPLGIAGNEQTGSQLPSLPYPEKAGAFSIHVQGLTVSFGKKKILNDLNLEFEGGQLVALVGRNGSGKTTLLRSLAGLQPFEGAIHVIRDGQDESDFPQLNMVFQNPDTQLFNPTVREEILYKIQSPNLELYEWLIQALKLENYQETQPLLLSEGEKRRLALAIAIMHPHHHGILLDEPSLGQDQAHKDLLIELLKTISRAGYLVFFATHDIELAAKADRMILIGEKGIIADGPTRNILQNQIAWQQAGLILPHWIAP